MNERRLMAQMDHAEFSYEVPPCAKHCGSTPAKCIDKGWFENDVYMYWYDEAERICKAIKSPVPTSLVSGLSKNAIGMGTLAVLLSLKDGAIDPGDLMVVYEGYQYAEDAKAKDKEQKKIQKLINTVDL